MNPQEINIQNKMPFIFRLYQYQKERFPIMVHGLLIACFTFSAIAFSRMSRGATGFIAYSDYAFAVGMTLGLFFLLRLFDEVKDHAEDIMYRKYLPVPRGLIHLSEIHLMIAAVITTQSIALIILKPTLIPLYLICLGYIFLMRVEFFVADWLRERQVWYILSHMLIIPLVDILASAADWKLAGAIPPKGLTYFFIVSFLNGLVLEIGRKMRAAGKEEEGVVSYTKLWGLRGAVIVWITILTLTLWVAISAAIYAGHPNTILVGLAITFVLCTIPCILFLKKPNEKYAKWIEHASGIWTLAMYLLLGGAPLLLYNL